MSPRSIIHLDHDECLALLRSQRVGRIAYCDDLGPLAVPVNFAVAGDDIVVRVESGNRALHALQVRSPQVAFEADHVDTASGSGWSVLVRGTARQIELDEVPSVLHELTDGPPLPWADGIHNAWVRISADSVTGRRLGEPAPPLVM